MNETKNYFIIISEPVREHCIQAIKSLPYGYEVVIRKLEKDITKRQRNYWHKLLDIIADDQAKDPEDLKMELKYEWLPLREVLVKGVSHLYPVSSEKISRDQYNLLIEKTLMIVMFLGLNVPSRSEYGV